MSLLAEILRDNSDYGFLQQETSDSKSERTMVYFGVLVTLAFLVGGYFAYGQEISEKLLSMRGKGRFYRMLLNKQEDQ